MGVLAPVEHLRDRSAGRWVLDVAVVAADGVAEAAHLIQGAAGLPGRPVRVVALLVVLAGPLLVRRVWPLPVFGWLVATATAAALWDERLIPAAALLVALYTVATLRPRRDALLAAAVLEVYVVASVVALTGTSGWYRSIVLSGLVAAALGLGLYVGTRRAYLAELRDRAARLERERDQQGALAAAAERVRIAHEMHDIVAHHLTVIVALSDGAVAASAASPERAADVMRSVSATGRRALADTRRLLGVLRPGTGADPVDTPQPVPDLADLDVLIDRVRAAGLVTSLEVHGAPVDVPSGIQLTVYRLVQEALTNTLKHGGPNARAAVRLDHLPGELRVQVDDDGAGARAPTPAGVGGGLIGMRERVHAYGGQVRSGPRAFIGWRVSAHLRLDDADQRGHGSSG